MAITPKPFDLAIYIGRFQPFHLGHLHVLEQANKLADHVMVMVGSSFRPRTAKNPFTFEERRDMLNQAGVDIGIDNLVIRPLRDYIYRDDRWKKHVEQVVSDFEAEFSENGHKRKPGIVLVGHEKDDSSWYLKEFPLWQSYASAPFMDISATHIRENLIASSSSFEEWASRKVAKLLPGATISVLSKKDSGGKAMADVALEGVRENVALCDAYKDSWAGAPYEPIHHTVDALVIANGMVLLVQRGKAPGKGLWALPGGFLDASERLLDGCLRELKEETGLVLSNEALRGMKNNPERSVTFDSVDRSERGRTLTTCFHIHLPVGHSTTVIAGDDAERAFWLPLYALRSENMFEDHFDIIDYFIPLAEGSV